MEDYRRAIDVREDLRTRLGEQWPPAMQIDLANPYNNRAVARAGQNALSKALEDYGRAIDLCESLREKTGKEWPKRSRALLVESYQNRASAFDKSGRREEATVDRQRGGMSELARSSC